MFNGGSAMEPMYISIQPMETGKHIKELMLKNGFSVKDIQSAMGFEQPQAVYKRLSGTSLPSIDNLVILSRLLHTNIENILVIDEDIAVLRMFSLRYFLSFLHLVPGPLRGQL